MLVYKIVQRKNHNVVYASGFYGIERAESWLSNYDPRMWDDKTIVVSDLEIVEETRRAPP